MRLLSLISASLLGRQSKPALEFGGSTFTFGDLEDRSNRLAHLLNDRNLHAGDRVAFFLQNRVEVIDLWLAAIKLGLVIVPVNVLYRERELRHILTDSDPAAVVTSADLEGFLPEGITAWDVDSMSLEAGAHPSSRLAIESSEGTPLALIYTSGTTGASKGAILTHGNFASNGSSLVESWRFTEKDRYLAALPHFHVHGLANGIHCWLLSGCHMRLVERFEHTKAAEWFEEYQPTVFFGVPAMYVRLLELPEKTARGIGSRLRLAVSGSAPLPPEVHEKFNNLYGSVILERYGMTETLMNISNPYDGERRPGTIGLPLPHVQAKICDETGNPLPAGSTGELWVKGPNVCSGYWRRTDATEASWSNGWFKTGDISERSPDGYVTLKGRRSDLIISGGFNIYPREIEELILEQPGVQEVAVVGVADKIRGEVPVAYVVHDGALFNEAEVASVLRSQLASFKQPRAFVRMGSLPRTALGKVQKHLLPKG